MKTFILFNILIFSLLGQAFAEDRFHTAGVFTVYNRDEGNFLMVGPEDNFLFEIVEDDPNRLTLRIFDKDENELGSNFEVVNANIRNNYIRISVRELLTTLEGAESIGEPPCPDCQLLEEEIGATGRYNCESISEAGDRIICQQNNQIIEMLATIKSEPKSEEPDGLLRPGRYVGDCGVSVDVISHTETEQVVNWGRQNNWTYRCVEGFCSVTYSQRTGLFRRSNITYTNQTLSSTSFVDENSCVYTYRN